MQLSFLRLLAILPLVVHALPTELQGSSITLTKRTSVTDEQGVVKPAVLQRQLDRAVAKLQRGFAAFERNTGAPHPDSFKVVQRRATGGDPLTDDEDGSLWQGGISVGTPAVAFTVDFDTGSSDLFLPGQNCKVNCAGHTVYNTAKSTTAKDLRKTYSLAFGDGSTVQGEQFTDTVSVAGLTATTQTVGASTQYSTGFAIDEFPPDGLMGMAFPQISVFGANPVFQTLVAQKKTTASEFGVKLSTSGSELFLGGVDSKLVSGAFTQVPLTQVGFWQVTMDSIGVNGKTAGTRLSAIIDTGTTLVIGDTTSVGKLYAAIPGAKAAPASIGSGFFTVPCNAIPTVSLTFGGKSFSISPATFNLGQVAAGSADCVGGVAAESGLPAMYVVGDVFLQNVYTSFNTGTQQVGFAKLA